MPFRVTIPNVSPEIEFGPLNFPEPNDISSFVEDVNGDGFDDLVSIGATFTDLPGAVPQEGVILLNDRRGGFDIAPGARPFGEGPRELAVEDFNGDGVLDIFIAEQGLDFEPFPGGQNKLLLGDGRGGYIDATGRLPLTNDFTHSVAASDIDADGDIDLYVGNIFGRDLIDPYLLINDGNAQFDLNRDLLPESVATGVSDFPTTKYLSSLFADVNGDGADDLILGADDNNGDDATAIFFNDGAGGFSDERVVEIPAKIKDGVEYNLALDVQAFDINADGLEDILLLQTQSFYEGWSIQILIQQEDGGFVDEASSRLLGDSENPDEAWGMFLRLEDINRDGLVDILLNSAVETARPVFMLNTGFGSYIPITGSEFPEIAEYLGSGDNFVLRDGANLRFAETFPFDGDPLLAVARTSGRPDFEGQFTRQSETITGDRGGDLVFANAGNDTVRGLGGADSIDGGGGKDMLIGGGGKDMLRGGGGKDTLQGGGGKDMLEGGRGKDELNGGGGRDTLKGDGGRDFLDGGGGADFLDGGRGRDDLTGGRGGDTFFFATGSGKDTITDFQQGKDRIEIGRGADEFADLAIRQAGETVEIAFSNVTIVVADDQVGNFSAADFIF